MAPKNSRFELQIRAPGRKYRTVETASEGFALAWSFRQYLSPTGENSVRIIDTRDGSVFARAVPRREP